MRSSLVALVGCLLLACSGDESAANSSSGSGSGGTGGGTGGGGTGGTAGAGGAPLGIGSLPAMFRMSATAEGMSDDGITATCVLDFIHELETESDRTSTFVEYPGSQGGEVTRTVVDETGAGFEFHADAFAQITARLTFPDAFEIDVPINETAEGRFWQALARFEGMIDEAGHGSGSWTCEPLDTTQDGYVDTVVSAKGTWETTPIAP